MLKSSDIQGRLRLLRYGLVVLVIVTFLVSLLSPYVFASAWASEFNKVAAGLEQSGRAENLQVNVTIATFLPNALIATVVVAVLAVIVYFVYSYILKKTVAPPSS